jgi:glyoxylase-like metal-dependent hydrolase (beta-lactamase superfamily II)
MSSLHAGVSYEAYALRYAHREGEKSDEFYCHRAYQEQDAPWGIDYYFWMLRNGDRTVLVDCGFDLESALRVGRDIETEPWVLLERLGVGPEAVDHVVITHMHADHIGNVDLFPNATFSVTREEYEFWTGPRSRHELFSWPGQPGPIAKVEKLVNDQRVTFVEQVGEVVPGVSLRKVGGHTAGSGIVEFESHGGRVVLASDAGHFYEEFERDRPYMLFSNLEEMYEAYGMLRDLSQQAGTVVVPGHDPRTRREFVEVATDCWDLSQPISGTGR